MADTLTPEQHRARHVELHRALDELVADFVAQGPRGLEEMRLPSTTTVAELMTWSHEQTLNPTEPKR